MSLGRAGNQAPPDGDGGAELVQNDELVRLLLNSTGEGIYGIDLKGNCTFANTACVKHLGFHDDRDLLGRNMHDLVHHTRPNGEEYPEKECRIYQALRQNEGTHVDDEVLFRADGSSFPVEYWSFPVFSDGTRVGCVVTFIDITERRLTEQRLERQSRALADMARFPEMNPGPVCRLDCDGTIVLANEAARNLFDDTKLVGKRWTEVCPGMTGELWASILESETMVSHETQVGKRYLLFTHTPGSDGNDIFSYGADLTEQRQAEGALRQAERMATLGTLAAGVAHELNNPAAAAQRAAQQLNEAFARFQQEESSFDRSALSEAEKQELTRLVEEAQGQVDCGCELTTLERSDRETEIEEWLEDHGVPDPWELPPALVEMNVDPEQLDAWAARFKPDNIGPVVSWLGRVYPVYRLLEEIRHAAGRLSEIVVALKSYSYVGQAPVQAVDVNDGLRNTLVILRNKLKQGITVNLELADDLPAIQAYGGELNQVWTNLIDNAAGAMNGKGQLWIRSRADNGRVVVEIEDDGPGIPEENQAHVFDAFFTTKAPGEGTGLGLHTSYSIVVKRHHGQIVLDSEPGRTRFTVILPVDGARGHTP